MYGVNKGLDMPSFIEVNGFNCRYELNRNLDAKETIIFINGIGNPLESWAQIKQPLEARYSTMTYDLRGQWFSEVATDKIYSFSTMADDLDQLMEKLDIANAHIVGTSLGGEVAQWFALKYPQRVNSLVLVASVSEANSLMCLMVERWKIVAENAIAALEANEGCLQTAYEYSDRFHDVFVPDIFSNKFITNNAQEIKVRKQNLRSLIKKTVYEGHVKLSEMFYKLKHEEKLTERLHHITCPTLVIGAEFDIVKPASFSVLLAEKIPNAKLHIFNDTGHAVLVERPAELTQLVEDLVISCSSSKASYNHGCSAA